MSTTNIWKMKSKSKNAVTIPTKAAVPKPTPAKPIAKKQAEVLKVKQVKTTAKSSQEAPQQQPQAQLQLSDFKMQMKADANNLHVTTTYQGTPIHAIILPAQEFAGWQRATQQQRYAYIQARVNPATFNNDLRLVQIIITSYVKRINTVFSIAQAQQQAQRRQQQAQRLVR